MWYRILEAAKFSVIVHVIELKLSTMLYILDTQSYVLNFHGRVTQASVKNFQIIHDADRKLSFLWTIFYEMYSLLMMIMNDNKLLIYFWKKVFLSAQFKLTSK